MTAVSASASLKVKLEQTDAMVLTIPLTPRDVAYLVIEAPIGDDDLQQVKRWADSLLKLCFEAEPEAQTQPDMLPALDPDALQGAYEQGVLRAMACIKVRIVELDRLIKQDDAAEGVSVEEVQRIAVRHELGAWLTKLTRIAQNEHPVDFHLDSSG